MKFISKKWRSKASQKQKQKPIGVEVITKQCKWERVMNDLLSNTWCDKWKYVLIIKFDRSTSSITWKSSNYWAKIIDINTPYINVLLTSLYFPKTFKKSSNSNFYLEKIKHLGNWLFFVKFNHIIITISPIYAMKKKGRRKTARWYMDTSSNATWNYNPKSTSKKNKGTQQHKQRQRR